MSVILFFALCVGAFADGSLRDVSTWQLTSAATILRGSLRDMLLQGKFNEIDKLMLKQTRSRAALAAEAIVSQINHHSLVMIDSHSIMGRVHADQGQHLALSPGLFAVIAIAIVLVAVPCVFLYCPVNRTSNLTGTDIADMYGYSAKISAPVDSPLLQASQPQAFRSPANSPSVSQASPEMSQIKFTHCARCRTEYRVPESHSGPCPHCGKAVENGRLPQVHAATSASASPCIGCVSPYTHSRLFVERCMTNRTGPDAFSARDVFTWFAKDSIRSLYNRGVLEVKNSHGLFASATLCNAASGSRPANRLEIACVPELGLGFHMFNKPVAIIAPLEYPAKLGANATMKGANGEFLGYFQRKRNGFTLSGGSHDISISVEPVEIGLVLMVHSKGEQIAAVRIANHRNDVRIDVKQGADRIVVVSTVVAAMVASQDVTDYFARSR